MHVDAEITGIALKMLDRTCLKDMGIKSLGKQLQILSRVKDLIGMYILMVFLHVVYIYYLIYYGSRASLEMLSESYWLLTKHISTKAKKPSQVASEGETIPFPYVRVSPHLSAAANFVLCADKLHLLKEIFKTISL